MYKNLRKKTEGFTIIEVLIVLAIAGLIMVVVFLAVPALQRNQRNTARRNDAARVVTSVSEYVTNSNGTLPPTSTVGATSIRNNVGTMSGYSITGVTNGTVPSNNQLGVVTYATASGNANVVAGSWSATDAIMVVTAANCNGVVPASSSTSRAYAVVFTLEGGSGYTQACLSNNQ